MELLLSIENFDNNGEYRELNSPRTLEACLRTGLDPSEVFPRAPKEFATKGLAKQMVDIKAANFEKKRLEKIELIRKERNRIIAYSIRRAEMNAELANDPNAGMGKPEEPKGPGLVEKELMRMEAMKRRQEKELAKTVEKEQQAVALQQKIKRAEEEEIKKQKAHMKKVQEQKKLDEKKRVQMEAEMKNKEQEELLVKKALAKKEQEVTDRIAKNALLVERQIAKEARERDEEMKRRSAEMAAKTQALLKLQEDELERNKAIMEERELRIQQQLIEKKEQKRIEVEESREKAAIRIAEANAKFHAAEERKQQEFLDRQRKAAALAKENAVLERERIKNQSEQRQKNRDRRVQRLIDAFNIRKDHREEVVARRNEKDKVFETVAFERAEEIQMLKFKTELKLFEKLENVDRVARVNEFKRLQTLQQIRRKDNIYEHIQTAKKEMLDKQMSEAKGTLIRKHEISDAMDEVRMTNDYRKLDALFKKKPESKKGGDDDEPEGAAAAGATGAAAGGGDAKGHKENKLAATI